MVLVYASALHRSIHAYRDNLAHVALNFLVGMRLYCPIYQNLFVYIFTLRQLHQVEQLVIHHLIL